MGNKYEEVTMAVNYKAAVDLARLAKKHGVKKFVYASVCSMYGAASEYPKKEDDDTESPHCLCTVESGG